MPTAKDSGDPPGDGVMEAFEADGETPVTRIEPRPGWHLIDLMELWRYRELLYFLTWRDIKVRYKQTVLGILWFILQPFSQLVIFSIIFGRVAKLDSEGYPYPIFLYAGLLPWMFFAQALQRSGESVYRGRNIFTNVYFPRLILPMASVGACLVDFAVSFVILLGLMVYYGVAPGPEILMVLPLVICTIFTALGVGALISALNTAYRDFRFISTYMIRMWKWVTPVIYSVTVVPKGWRWALSLNPMSGIIDSYRSAILGKPFAWGNLGISMAVAVLGFLAGAMVFRRLERQFADIV
jgi:lipopolysaccharide transport system permease protein